MIHAIVTAAIAAFAAVTVLEAASRAPEAAPIPVRR